MKRNITVSKVIVISTLESLLLARQQWSCCSVNVGCAVWFYTLLPTENHIKINMHAMENISLLFVNSTNAAWLILQPCDCAFFFFFPIFLQKDMFLSLPRLCITLSGLGTPCFVLFNFSVCELMDHSSSASLLKNEELGSKEMSGLHSSCSPTCPSHNM